MPKKCCVPGCVSNYKGQEYTSVFAFPSDSHLKEKWLTSIPRKDYVVTKHSAVCIKHFHASYIQTDDPVKRDKGSLIGVRRKKPRLREDAVPTIFQLLPSSPSHLSKKRKLFKDELETFDSHIIQNSDDTISSFQSLCTEINEHVNDWVIIKSEHVVTCCRIDTLGCPYVRIAVKIKPDFSPEIFYDGLEINAECFAFILSSSLKVNTWSKLETLL